MDISAIIVADSPCPDIRLTVSSVQDLAKEILVIDIGLDADTKEVVRSIHPSVVFIRLEKPDYVELIRQQTFGYASYPWIILLDPDEYLSPDLVRYIQGLDADIEKTHTHLKIPRQNYIFGKWISHSRWWPDYQIRLFQKDSITWPQVLHAQPELVGKGYIVPAFENEKIEMNARTIVHHNYTTILQYLEKNIRYSRVEAKAIVESEKAFTILDATRKSTSEFISRFFADKGYKDGIHGLVLALLQAFYALLVFLEVWELKGYPEATQTTVIRAAEQFFIKTSKEIFHWLHRDKLTKGTGALVDRIRSRLL